MEFICRCTQETPVVERLVETQSGKKTVVSKGFLFNLGTGSCYAEMEGEKCKQLAPLDPNRLYVVSISIYAINYNKGDGDKFFNKLLVTKIAEL